MSGVNATPLVWLITGCSSGLGTSLARSVLAHGHTLIASSRNPSKTPELVQEVASKGGHWIALDTTAPDLEDVVAQAERLHGKLDVVVNNAGMGFSSCLEMLSSLCVDIDRRVSHLRHIRGFQVSLSPFPRSHVGHADDTYLCTPDLKMQERRWKPTSGALAA